MPFRVLYIDVDGTMVDVNDPDVLREGVLEKLELWHKKYTLICWSKTGGQYAKKVCEYHKIAHLFSLFLDKPDGAVDDDFEWWGRVAKLDVKDDDAWSKSDSELFRHSREDKR